MTRLIAVLSLTAVFAVATPRGAAAEGCTEDYMSCIAEAGLLPEPYQSMKDVECGASYVGCVGGLMKFW